MTNAWFACVCLAIFGVASRWSSDSRVLPDEVADKAAEGGDDGIWTLAGWRYIAVGMSESHTSTFCPNIFLSLVFLRVNACTEIHETRRSVMLPPELFEIQSFSVSRAGAVVVCGEPSSDAPHPISVHFFALCFSRLPVSGNF